MMFFRKDISLNKDILEEVNNELIQEKDKQIQSLKDRIQSLENELSKKAAEIKSYKEGRDIIGITKNLANIWRVKEPIDTIDDDIYFDDTVYDHITVDKKLAPLFSHPLVQRLNFIKQLSFGYYAYPTATHTRLAHSLGTYNIIENALTTIFRKGEFYTKDGLETIKISDEERNKLLQKAKIVALLHDIGHGPYCHALDRYITYEFLEESGQLDKHYCPIYIAKFLSPTIAQIGVDPEEIIKILSKAGEELTGFDNFIADLIDSPLDVDRIDYLARDAYSTGLYEGAINVYALIEHMIPYKENDKIMLAYKEAAVPYIEHFMYARDIMFIKCYEHPVKVSSDYMIIKALENFLFKYNLKNKDYIDDIVLLTDEQLLDLINICSTEDTRCWRLMDSLRKRNIFEKVHEINLPVKNGEEISVKINYLTESITEGNHKHAYIDLVRDWEEEIAKKAGLPEEDSWKIAISVSSPEVYLQKEAYSKILLKNNDKYECKEIYDVSPLLKAGFTDILRRSRWKIRIFVWPEFNNEQKNTIIKETKAFLGV